MTCMHRVCGLPFFFLTPPYLYSTTKKDLLARYLIDFKANNVKDNLLSLAHFLKVFCSELYVIKQNF